MCMCIKIHLILVNLAGGWLNVQGHFNVGQRRRDTGIMPPSIKKLFARGLTPCRFASLLSCSSHYMTLNVTVDDQCRMIDYMPCICSMYIQCGMRKIQTMPNSWTAKCVAVAFTLLTRIHYHLNMLTLAGHRRHTPAAEGYDGDEQFVANDIDELSTLLHRIHLVTHFLNSFSAVQLYMVSNP